MARAQVQAIVLAAGRSSRFKSDTSKLLFTLCGQEMIIYPLKTLQQLAIPVTLVVGYKKDHVKKLVEHYSFDGITYVEQPYQLGTGDAVASTVNSWNAENILVMNGDMPLIQPALIKELMEAHFSSNAAVSFVMAHNNDPLASTGYGRVVVRDDLTSIVEARDFNGDPSVDCFVNAGIYIFRRDFIKTFITTLRTHENSQELYLTDLVEIASRQKLPIATVNAPFDTVRGVNTLKELWIAEQIKRAEIIEHWMNQGVRFSCAQATHIDINVSIAAGTFVDTGAQILLGTRIGKHSYIGPFSVIKNSVLGEQVTVYSHSVIIDTTVGDRAQVGPFAHIHHNNNVGMGAVVGNFVEVSRSAIAHDSKIKHHSYIGNAHIGARVNIGAGTVTCNYNGVTKNTTVIEDDAFIGSNNALIAPVTIGHNAMTGAGSVITEDVPAYALAIARAQQVTKPDYVSRLRNSVTVGAAVKVNDSSLE
jgi:bifunctional UDP-N-acetylglucosamine pyrophosphorylase/glucosamine-1-phosphate N-acetyltransferase